MFPRLMAPLACIAIFATCASSAFAAPGDKKNQLPIIIDLQPVQVSSRSSAFYPVRCRLMNTRPEIFSGSLKMTGLTHGRVLFQIRIPDFAVSDQTLEFLTNFPPVTTEGSLDLRAELFDATGKSLGDQEFNLVVPRSGSRRMVVGNCHLNQRSVDAKTNDLLTSFNLQLGLPEEQSTQKDPLGFEVVSFQFDPQDLPDNSLEFTRFDLLVLAEDAWPVLKEKQKNSLLEWVSAGGSVCVLIPSRPPQDAYPFLNKLAGRDIPPPLPAAPPSEPVLKEIISRRLGLGRIVLLPQQVFSDLNLASELWRTQIGFLWKVRQGHRSRYVNAGKWEDSKIFVKNAAAQPVFDYEDLNSKPLSVPRLRSFDQLLWQLKPPQMGMIPLPWLLASLGLYVLMIGPVDYYLLGALRARKWTWVVFPLVTLGFTWGMFSITNKVMGFNDQLRSLTIVDWTDSEFSPRVNDLELRMFSMPQTVHSERKQEFQTPLDWQQSSMMIPQVAGNDDRTLDEQAPRYTGRIPSNSDMMQYVRQWAPQFRRGMRFGSELTFTGFPWQQFADPKKYPASKVFHDSTLQVDIVKAAHSTLGSNCSLYLFHKNQSILIGGPPVLQASQFEMKSNSPTTPAAATVVDPRDKSFLDSICVYPEKGMFKLVSQISPTGGRTLEDLPLLDPDDQDQWLLLIAVPEQNNLKIYRRRYGGADSW